MVGKRGQVLCSNDATMLENMHYDESIGGMNCKRHCKVRSPFDISSPTPREATTADCNILNDSASAATVSHLDSATRLHHITSQWSDKIIEGLKSLNNTRDLKGQLCDFLTEFYRAVSPLNIDNGNNCGESPDAVKEELMSRINQLTQRNSVLCNVVRHQYDMARRLQASEALNASLMKDNASLSEELQNLKECINSYVSSMDSGGVSPFEPFGSHFTRRPPDVF
ncbi:hypothetical protein X943_003065 [Babesia divergens]|uniref:Uncharacterized protein n=1 Tax=Babesia divergens TaxID=32595 RepID=A0AAD9G7K5_BABDI|nr:hypothetical protein X943_003065 [Babesia divergens]